MTEAEFQRLAAQGFNRVPLVAETFADLETPLSLYLKLANRTHTYLLESVVGGERFGRYSFIGLAAPVRLRAVGRLVTVTHGDAITENSPACPGSAEASSAISATTRCVGSSPGSPADGSSPIRSAAPICCSWFPRSLP